MNRHSITERLARAVLGLVVLALACVVAPARAADSLHVRRSTPSIRWRAQLDRADSLSYKGRGPYVAYIDSLLGAGRSAGDSGLVMLASIHRASTRTFQGALDEGKAEAALWLPRARAAHDTMLTCLALRTLGLVELIRQHYPESVTWYVEMRRLARNAHLGPMEGYALIGTGFVAMQSGRVREAERDYRRSVRLFENTQHRFASRTARAGLANSLYHQGRADESRREYEAVLASARADGDLRNAADATNDLGALEFQYGDPSLAVARYREAYAIQQKLGRQALSLLILGNVGLSYQAMGDHDAEVAAIYDSVATMAAAIGARDALAGALASLASIRRVQGDLVESERLSRRVLAMGDSVNLNVRASAMAALARTLIAAGREADGDRELQQELAGGKVDESDRSMLLDLLGEVRIAAALPDSAIPPLREAAAIARRHQGQVGAAAISSETSLGDAFRALGRLDSALVHYRYAAATWERRRADASAASWRESFGSAAAGLYGSYATALLDPRRGGTPTGRAAEAFAALQPFRARTLEEALRGAAARPQVARVTLAELRAALGNDELFLDLYAAVDTTILFAVTRTTLRAVGLPAWPRLTPPLRRFADLLAAPDDDREQLAAAAAALGRDLFGGIADLLAPRRTVLLAAGRIGQYPLGMLRLPGEREPIAARRQWAVVPSATLLAAARAARTAHGSGVLALCRTTDASGQRLEGVSRESRWLARAYPRAEVRDNDGRRELGEMLGELGRREVLHIASHARGSAAAPWRAGFLLGRGEGEDAWLTASRIAALPNPARVCVLAGCTSAGSAAGSEAIPNLAAAWLTSGASAVIASLWPVGDEATARFVEQFYRGLFRGRTTGEALADAQRAVSARGSVPARDWAGFVLIGDPETRVAIASATPATPGRATPSR